MLAGVFALLGLVALALPATAGPSGPGDFNYKYTAWRCLPICLNGTVNSLFVRKRGVDVMCYGPNSTTCAWHKGAKCGRKPRPKYALVTGVQCSIDDKWAEHHWCYQANQVLVAGAVPSCPPPLVSAVMGNITHSTQRRAMASRR